MKKVLLLSFLFVIFGLFGCNPNNEPEQYCAVTITANSSNDLKIKHITILDANSRVENTSNYLGTYNATAGGKITIDLEYVCYRCSGFSAKWLSKKVSIPVNSAIAMTIELKYGRNRPNTSSHSYVDVYINGALWDSVE